MNEMSAGELHQILYQDNADSYPLREDFEMLRSKLNQAIQAINGVTTAASGSETSGARPYHASLGNKLDETMLGIDYVKTGFLVAERATPIMGVKVSAGKAQVNGVFVRKGYGVWARVGTTVTITEENHGRSNTQTIVIEVSSATTPLPLGEYAISNCTTNTFDITGVDSGATSGTCEFATCLGPITVPAAGKKRWDTAVIQSDNSLAIVTGADAASPTLPSRSSSQKKLGHIYMTDAQVDIQTADIRDARKEAMTGLTFLGWGPPIGAIIPWHKTLTGCPALPEEYQECDGTGVVDPESPFYGETLPDLTSGRYLKGAATSGTLGASSNKAHTHDVVGIYEHVGGTGPLIPDSVQMLPAQAASEGIQHDQLTDTGAAISSGLDDSEPKNMTAVMVMRIK